MYEVWLVKQMYEVNTYQSELLNNNKTIQMYNTAWLLLNIHGSRWWIGTLFASQTLSSKTSTVAMVSGVFTRCFLSLWSTCFLIKLPGNWSASSQDTNQIYSLYLSPRIATDNTCTLQVMGLNMYKWGLRNQ